jgi:hypothetical protein
MKMKSLPEWFIPRSHWLAALACGLTCLLTSAGHVAAQIINYNTTGFTYLNVYFTDGYSTVGSTVSPYNPQECIYSGASPGTTPPQGVGMPLSAYGPGSWLQTGTPTPAPYPGAFSGATWTSGTMTGSHNPYVTAAVSYEQSPYAIGSNSVSSSTLGNYGTSLYLDNPGTATAELRVDWTGTYTYSVSPNPPYDPTYYWPGSYPAIHTLITDSGGNLWECTSITYAGPPTPTGPAGTTGATVPTFSASPQVDNYVVWTEINSWWPGGTPPLNAFILDQDGYIERCSAVSGPGTTGSSEPIASAWGAVSTLDNNVVWTREYFSAPGSINVTISGSLGTFSALTGEESISVNGATPELALIPQGANFPAWPYPPVTCPAVDSYLGDPAYSSLYPALNGFTAPLNSPTYYSTASGVALPPQNLVNGDSITVSGYMDMFVDPGTLKVQVMSSPALGIGANHNNVTVSWPAWATNYYKLQTSTNLASGNWVTNSSPTASSNGTNITSILNSAGSMFFRLR